MLLFLLVISPDHNNIRNKFISKINVKFIVEKKVNADIAFLSGNL